MTADEKDPKTPTPLPIANPSKPPHREDTQLRIDRQAFHSLQMRITELTNQLALIVEAIHESDEVLAALDRAITRLTALVQEQSELLRALVANGGNNGQD